MKRIKYTEPLRYHLYRIVLLATGQFYFGATSNIDGRKDQWFKDILSRILELRQYDRECDINRKKQPVLPPVKNPSVEIIAKRIKPLVKKIFKPQCIIQQYYKLESVESFATTKEASDALQKILQSSKEDKLCMNIIFQSNFNKQFKPKKSAYEF